VYDGFARPARWGTFDSMDEKIRELLQDAFSEAAARDANVAIARARRPDGELVQAPRKVAEPSMLRVRRSFVDRALAAPLQGR